MNYDQMKPEDFVVIGRCKVLFDKIKELHSERQRVISYLSLYASHLQLTFEANAARPVILEIDVQKLTGVIEEIVRVNDDLMHTVRDYNNLCDVKPIELISQV